MAPYPFVIILVGPPALLLYDEQMTDSTFFLPSRLTNEVKETGVGQQKGHDPGAAGATAEAVGEAATRDAVGLIPGGASRDLGAEGVAPRRRGVLARCTRALTRAGSHTTYVPGLLYPPPSIEFRVWRARSFE